MTIDWSKSLKILPSTLALIALALIVAGYFLLPAGEDPPMANVVVFALLAIIVIVLGGWLFWLDQKTKLAQERAAKAEEEANNLRQTVEHALGEGQQSRDRWRRPMLQLPLDPAQGERVLQTFDEAMKVAFEALKALKPEALAANVRANVFLPTCENATDGDVCNLVIPHIEPNGLQRNMIEVDERSIRFRPNDGATGRAFVECRAIGACVNPEWVTAKIAKTDLPEKRWLDVQLRPDIDLSNVALEAEKFRMTKAHEKKTDQTLAWIISMPIVLRCKGKLEVVGVFNIDCLQHQVDPDQLRAIFYRVAPYAGVISGIFANSPTDLVVILRFT